MLREYLSYCHMKWVLKMYGRTGKGNSNTNILKFLFSKIVVYGLETGPFS